MLVQSLKLNQVFLDNEMFENLKDKVNIENVLMYYQFAKVFNLPTLAKETFRCMERCFTMVVETRNFLQSDFTVVSRLLSSSKLAVCSELEVFYAAEAWLNHNTAGRLVFAEYILLKIRFPLLSDHALEHVLQTPLTFVSNEKNNLLVKDILQYREDFFLRNKSNNITRYCDHDEFNIVVIGGNMGWEQFANQIDKRGRVTPLRSFIGDREDFCSVRVNNDVYVFQDGDEGKPISVLKYSPSRSEEDWRHLCYLDSVETFGFSLCAFMNKIYVVGGMTTLRNCTRDCIEFDPKSCEWKHVGEMNVPRNVSATAVFEGRLVACGGITGIMVQTNTAEAYDHVADQWSYMPSMIETRNEDKAVALRNKLFVFGSYPGSRTNEVYDSVCNKFAYLKPPKISLRIDFDFLSDVTLVGSRIMIFITKSPFMAVYDVVTDEWSEESCEVTTEDCLKYTSVKLPIIFNKV